MESFRSASRIGHRRGRLGAIASSLLCGLLALPLSCAINPVSGDRELIFMSEEDEQEIDDRESKNVEEFLGLIDNPELAAYVEKIGQTLAANAPRRRADYHFGIVEMDAPNAFALPGGHIYISRGLLILSNSEAELANVIGHEIGHVAARHAAQRDVASKAATVASILGTVGAVMGGGDGRAVAGVQTLSQGMVAAYGRGQEKEADVFGQDLAAITGVDPAGMADFLRGLDRTVRLEEGFSRQISFFDTHPSTPERVAEATTRAQVLRWQPKFGIARTRETYLAKLDGMTVGKPASEGVVRRGRFMHPTLRFSVAFPRGWEVSNQRSFVIATAADGEALTLLQLHSEGTDPKAAAEKWAEEEERALEDARSIRIGDLPAFRARTEVEIPGGEVRAEVVWVAHRGLIYRLSGAAKGGAFRGYEGTFRGFARSFRELRPEEEGWIDDIRLRIAEALPGEDIKALSRRTGNVWDPNRTAVVNGMIGGGLLVPGTLLKIGVAEPFDFEAAAAAAELRALESESESSESENPEPNASDPAGDEPEEA